jgi:hypothetical protein
MGTDVVATDSADSVARLVGSDRLTPKFPLLVYDGYSFATEQTVDDLGIAWTSLIKSGWFDGLVIYDSLDRTFRVTRIAKVRGVRRFWGWNPLYGRRLALEVHTKLHEVQHPFSKVKQDVVELLTRRSEWRSRDDYDALLADVENASSIEQLISDLSGHGI